MSALKSTSNSMRGASRFLNSATVHPCPDRDLTAGLTRPRLCTWFPTRGVEDSPKRAKTPRITSDLRRALGGAFHRPFGTAALRSGAALPVLSAFADAGSGRHNKNHTETHIASPLARNRRPKGRAPMSARPFGGTRAANGRRPAGNTEFPLPTGPNVAFCRR